ncbi:MAG: DUF58 domain-containing protein [Planctomycetota bacterium]|jgi:uncharacterized protein (DUF58 family)
MARTRYVPFTLRYWRYLWRYKLTPAGRFLFWSVLFTSGGLATVIIPVYQVFCVLLSVYLVVWCVNLLFRPKLRVVGELPRRVTAGGELRAEFELVNQSWRPAYDLMLWIIGLPESFRLLSADRVIQRLGPGESVTLPLILQPSRRGVYPLPDLRPHSTFPFNLMRSGATKHRLGTTTVLPHFHPIDELDVPVGQKYQPGGVALSSHIGESPEYIGNREYVPGEPIRRIDFRGWARLGKPVVREFQEEYYCRIALILDTWIPSRRVPRDGFPQLEAAISLSASIADALAATEHLIDIFAAGPELYVFRAGRQLAHFDNVLEILAAVDSCRDDPFAKVTPAVSDELSSITTAVCVFLDWDDSRADLAREIVEAGCQLKLVIVRDGVTTKPIDGVGDDVTVLTPERIRQGGFDRL